MSVGLVSVGNNSGAMAATMLKCVVLVLWTFFLTTDGRPEPPYNYPNPSLRTAPTANLGGSIQSQNFKSSQQNYNTIPSGSYGTPILRNTNSQTTSFTSSGGIQQGYNGAALPSRSYGTPDRQASHQTPSNRYIPQDEQVSIQKHIYVHVAPPEEEQRQQRTQQPPVSNQKHYKIIFIKAPSYNPPAPYIAPQQALQEEKTLVYVLVKKPEEAPEVPAQQVAPAKINKPEVYFIKYKERREQNLQQQVENVHQDNESVVIESAAGRGASGSTRGTASTYNQGYNYDRPHDDSVTIDSAASRGASTSASASSAATRYNQGYNYDRPQDDSVVIDSADSRGATSSASRGASSSDSSSTSRFNQGYNYDRPQDDSVVIDSADGRGATSSASRGASSSDSSSASRSNQGYNYDRPQDDSFVVDSAASRGTSSSASGYNQGYNYDRPTGTLN